MKHIHFDVESDGFYGAYWACKDGSSCAVIAMLGDDPEDYMARSAVKWLLRLGVNILTMSPGKNDYGHHNYPLEYIKKAVAWLKLHGNEKIVIAGASTTGTLALRAADRNPYSWNMELYEYPDDSGYEGRFTKCGICVLMKKLGLYDLTPALCHLDYTMSEADGATDFVRQYTLASGGPYCDCGYKKKGFVKAGTEAGR